MKKVLLVLISVFIMASTEAQVYIGGGISAWIEDKNGTETGTIEFLPEIGFFVGKRWAIGGVLGYSQKQVEGTKTFDSFEFAPYARFTFYNNELVRLFVDGTFSVYSSETGTLSRVETYSLGLKPGLSLDLSEKISLYAKFGFFGFRQYDEDHTGVGFNLNGNNLSLGMYLTF